MNSNSIDIEALSVSVKIAFIDQTSILTPSELAEWHNECKSSGLSQELIEKWREELTAAGLYTPLTGKKLKIAMEAKKIANMMEALEKGEGYYEWEEFPNRGSSHGLNLIDLEKFSVNFKIDFINQTSILTPSELTERYNEWKSTGLSQELIEKWREELTAAGLYTPLTGEKL